MATAAKEASRRVTPSERRSRILRAAAEVFFEHGFSATTIDMIIARVGGSKRAIYGEFGNKEALFTELVTELADDVLRPLRPPDDDAPEALREILLRFARSLMAIYTSKDLVGVYRSVITEAYRFPHLARAFYENGPGRAARELKSILDEAVSRDEILSTDTAAAADHFVGMVRDNLHLQIVLGLCEIPAEDELQRRAASAVDIFIAGVAIRTSANTERAK